MKKRLKQLVRHNRQFLLYSIIGVSGITIDIVVFLFLRSVFSLDPAVATIVSTSCGITNNFFLNRRYNFKRSDHTLGRFFSFYTVGFIGILASVISLVVFSDLFGINATIVKLVSIPIIVIGQYVLNKYISFSDYDLSLENIYRTIFKHKVLLVMNAVFVTVCLLLIRSIPLTTNTIGAPDEYIHYGKNVQFIIENQRLPISGKDDIENLSKCRNNQYGRIPCVYSYQINPALNYITSATTATLAHALGQSYLVGARVASLLWGLIFINMTYLTTRLFLSRKRSFVVTAVIGFIPQVVFISSYVNQDIHSLAIASLLVYFSLQYLYRKHVHARIPFYISFGLLFAAKYNYFIIALVPAFLLLHKLMKMGRRPVGVDIGCMFLSSLILSGFWYIRNLLLYSDPLGQRFVVNEMAKYHPLGVATPFLEVGSYIQLFHYNFFNALFVSFFANFGYLYIQLADEYYAIIKAVLITVLIALLYYGNSKSRKLLLAAVAFTGLAIAQVIYNSFSYDYQPQGRYLFVILPVIVVAVSYALGQIARTKSQIVSVLMIVLLSTSVLVWVESASVLIQALGRI